MFERFEKFSYAIAVLHRYLHNITREEMKPYGLKGPHAMYLLVLLRNGEGMTAVELGEACFRNKADVSRSLAEFEEKGLIEREGSAAGAYRARICLTEAGRRAAEGLRERAQIAVGVERMKNCLHSAKNMPKSARFS